MSNKYVLLAYADELREILGCACWFSETNDGRAYNLKTEEYEDCECVRKIEAIDQYTTQQLKAFKEAVLEAMPEKQEITTKYLHSKQAVHQRGIGLGYNQAITEATSALSETLDEFMGSEKS